MKRQVLAALATTLATGGALAASADYVLTPAVEYGEREVDFTCDAALKKTEPSQQAASHGLGCGATEWWFTEFYVNSGSNLTPYGDRT